MWWVWLLWSSVIKWHVNHRPHPPPYYGKCGEVDKYMEGEKGLPVPIVEGV